MLRIMHVEEISRLLLQVPDIVDKMEHGSNGFVSAVRAWLDDVEHTFEQCRVPHVATIATLKGQLIGTEQGRIPDHISFRGRPTRLKVTRAVAQDAMQKASDLASDLVTSNEQRITEAHRIAQQIIAAAKSRSVIPEQNGTELTAYLRAVRNVLREHADLENAAVALEGLVGPNDALALIDRALSQFMPSTPHS